MNCIKNGIKKEGESCTLNNNCIYPNCMNKQETLEEREPYWDLVDAKAEQNNTIDLDVYAKGVQDGVKWMQERSYSEEEVLKLIDRAFHMYASSHRHDAKEWLVEQFKKK